MSLFDRFMSLFPVAASLALGGVLGFVLHSYLVSAPLQRAALPPQTPLAAPALETTGPAAALPQPPPSSPQITLSDIYRRSTPFK